MNRNDAARGIRLYRRLGAIARSEAGSLSVEAVLVFPMLFWVLAATFVYFDAFKTRNAAARATFTVTDMIARETGAINKEYLQGAVNVITQLTGDAQDPRMRVTVLRCTADCANEEGRRLEIVWSQAVGPMLPVPAEAVDTAGLRGRIPAVSLGSSVVMVESEVDWTPWFNVGLPDFSLGNVVVMRPRFSPQICWKTCAKS